MGDVHRFDFSQNTFGGSLACTAVATCTACAFADDDVEHEKFRTYCEVGTRMWRAISPTTISVQQILDHYTFFNETYEIESYQSCLREDDDEDGKFIPIHDLLATVRREMDEKARKTFGMVFTDGASSFACGYKGGKWWIFDSHFEATLWRGTQDEAEDRIRRNACMRIVDCTTFAQE
tara:strand:- start:3621 stop:4154 length:534 start_codon:yes stop_codon:yes gene_type:complete